MKGMKFLIAILVAGAVIIPLAFGIINNPRKDAENSVGILNPLYQPLIEKLKPSNYSTPISEEEASEIAEEAIDKPISRSEKSVFLIRNYKWNKTFWEISLKGPVMICVDAESGEVIRFVDCTNCEGGKDMIRNIDRAVEIAKGHLLKFGFKIDDGNVSEPDVTIDEGFTGKEYSIYWEQELNGIRIENGYIIVNLDPSNGNLISFIRIWQDVSHVNAIPEVGVEKAIEIARNKLMQCGVPENATVGDVNLEILRPNYFWNHDHPVGKLGNYTLAWTISFTYETEFNPSYKVWGWIDAHNGNLIGGDAFL